MCCAVRLQVDYVLTHFRNKQLDNCIGAAVLHVVLLDNHITYLKDGSEPHTAYLKDGSEASVRGHSV